MGCLSCHHSVRVYQEGGGIGSNLVLTMPGCPNVKDMGPFLVSRE